MYLNYEEYNELGGKLENARFNQLELRAEKKVDLQTFKRFKEVEELPRELKECMYLLIEELNDDRDTSISSEKIGNYSVTYSDNNQSNEKYQKIIKDCLVNTKINGVNVLYRGF